VVVKSLIWLSIISGFRSNSFRMLMIISFCCVVLALLASSFSARSPETLLLDVGLSLQRIVLTLMAVFWVQELYYKDLEKKTAIFLLAYPLSRAQYLISRFVGVSVLVTCAVMLSALMLVVAVAVSGIEYQQAWPINLGLPYVATWVYFWLDILIVVGFAFLLCSFSETPNLPVLCAIGFSIAMHSMGPILDYLRFSAEAEESHQLLIQPFIENVLYFLPDLDRLDIRVWTLYGQLPPFDLMVFATIAGVAYVAAFISLSIWGLNRREIS
jgi:Cu-processing system permease protein